MPAWPITDNISVPSLTSRRHPVVQRFRAAAVDRQAPWILLDGEHLLAEALAAGVRLDTVLDGGRYPAIAARAREAGATVFEAGRAVLEAARPGRTPSGIVARAERAADDLSAVFTPAGSLVVGLVDVQDPGNVGSILRSADALGARGAIAIGSTADPFGWKALRGAMGSTFHLRVAAAPAADAIAEARRRGVRIAAAVARGGRVDAGTWQGPLLLLLGNEGAGLDAALVQAADVHVSVPIRPGVDSLNVNAAAAILLWEAAQARLTPAAAR
jgi:TrmH family RNA methyltransferase